MHCSMGRFGIFVFIYLLVCCTDYPNGVRLVNALDNKSLMAFNAPNETDRAKFVTDLRESIAEVEQMEGMRIGGEYHC